jgi:carbamoyltransferase
MMGVSPEVFSAWRAEYAEVLDKLIIRSAGQIQPNAVTKTIAGGRIAYLTGCVGGEEIESELRACKLRYAVIENPAAVAGDLLRSGSILGNFQESISWTCFPMASRRLLEGSSNDALPPPNSELSVSSSGQPFEKQKREVDGSQIGQERVSLLVLVSAQIVDLKGRSPRHEASPGETALSGAFSAEVDELRWRTHMAGRDQIDEPIIRGVGLKFSLDGILDTPSDAIRAFYTSPVDALLLGNFLIRKSDSPTRRA